MSVTELPTPQALASLVSRVTETMFGVSFGLEGSHDTIPQDTWRAAILPIEGERNLTVAIAADPASCALLSAAIFGCDPGDVDTEMVDDSLSELANIVAGQIKVAMSVDDALGLPSVIDTTDPRWRPPERWRSATLSRGSVEARVWVAVSEQPFA